MRFRREALRKLEGPEQLDAVVRLATVPTWLVTGALLVIVAAAGLWAVTGEVVRAVKANGVLVHSAGVSGLDATESGQVAEVWVGPNQRVARGRPLYSVVDRAGGIRTVASPWDAYVVQWLVNGGELLQPGTRVADMERLDSPGDALQAVVWLPAAYAPAMHAGSPVEVTADAAPRPVFGTIRGTVSSVGAFPESDASLRAFLGDRQDVGSLLTAGSVVRVTVRLDADPASPSGLRWTKAPPPFRLTSASRVTARFVTATEHPIDWMLAR
jgi:multidrug efflux pump subunit AcrA (membrane-fusion protein)